MVGKKEQEESKGQRPLEKLLVEVGKRRVEKKTPSKRCKSKWPNGPEIKGTGSSQKPSTRHHKDNFKLTGANNKRPQKSPKSVSPSKGSSRKKRCHSGNLRKKPSRRGSRAPPMNKKAPSTNTNFFLPPPSEKNIPARDAGRTTRRRDVPLPRRGVPS